MTFIFIIGVIEVFVFWHLAASGQVSALQAFLFPISTFIAWFFLVVVNDYRTKELYKKKDKKHDK